MGDLRQQYTKQIHDILVRNKFAIEISKKKYLDSMGEGADWVGKLDELTKKINPHAGIPKTHLLVSIAAVSSIIDDLRPGVISSGELRQI